MAQVAELTALFAPGQVVTPSDGEAYQAAISRWADNAVRPAKFVVFPKSAEDVSKAVTFAVSQNLDIAVKCGGHSTSGASSSTDLVIDLNKFLNTVEVDAEKKLLTIGGGALWADVDAEASKFGLATVGGTVNHTGVGGLTVGGGYGWLTGRYGMTIDNVVQAQVVTASGEILTCSESENADLFWAIRGGGGNFGVVTSFVFKAYPQENPVWAGLLAFTPDQLEPLVAAVNSWLKTRGPDESMFMYIACLPPTFAPSFAVLPFFNGPAEEAKLKFKAILDVGPVMDSTQEIPYNQMNGLQNAMATHGERKYMKASALAEVDVGVIKYMHEKYSKLIEEEPDTKHSALLVELHGFEKVVEVPNDAMAFNARGPWYNINCVLRWTKPELDSKIRAWATELSAHVRTLEKSKFASKTQELGSYSNYGTGDDARARDVFGANYERLSVIKGKYDPNGIFKKWYPITPKVQA